MQKQPKDHLEQPIAFEGFDRTLSPFQSSNECATKTEVYMWCSPPALLQEVNNGRLAMLAITGLIAQDLLLGEYGKTFVELPWPQDHG